MSTFRALLVALAVDNLGSGMFLPLTLVWLTRQVGLRLGTAGVVLTVGTVVGTAMPALTARVVDRLGARTVVASSQVAQAAGMTAYLLAHGPVLALLGALLTACGTQAFYSSLNTMTADAADGIDTAFAQVGRVRGLAFGVGGLIGGWLLAANDERALAVGVVANIVSFLLAAALLVATVPSVRHRPADDTPTGGAVRVLHDRPYLTLLATTFCFMLTVELFLLAVPVYAHDRLGVPGWAVGLQITALTVIGATASAWVVRRTAHLTRTTCLRVGGVALLAWSLLMAALAALPADARTTVLLAAVPVFCAGNLMIGPRLPALVGAVAPPARTGAYFAYFQYAFTAAQLAAPLVTALLGWRLTSPWLANAALVTVGLAGVSRLRRTLPPGADAQPG